MQVAAASGVSVALRGAIVAWGTMLACDMPWPGALLGRTLTHGAAEIGSSRLEAGRERVRFQLRLMTSAASSEAERRRASKAAMTAATSSRARAALPALLVRKARWIA